MLNLDMHRLMHQHGDEWVEFTPIADHSPDARDPERRLVHGAQAFRCKGCDEVIRFEPHEGPG